MAALLGLALQAPLGASAQQAPVVLTVNQDRLWLESTTAQQIRRELEAKGAALLEENRQIDAELENEERVLADKRSTMEAKAFAELADAFDAKVVELRRRQDAKGQALSNEADDARRRFFEQTGPVLLEIMDRYGGAVLLDTRMVVLSRTDIDITDEAIENIDTPVLEEERE